MAPPQLSHGGNPAPVGTTQDRPESAWDDELSVGVTEPPYGESSDTGPPPRRIDRSHRRSRAPHCVGGGWRTTRARALFWTRTGCLRRPAASLNRSRGRRSAAACGVRECVVPGEPPPDVDQPTRRARGGGRGEEDSWLDVANVRRRVARTYALGPSTTRG